MKSLHVAWGEKLRAMMRMDQSSRIRPGPDHAGQVFRVDEMLNGMVKVNCGPAVFNLREKANNRHDRQQSLYVVVEGWLYLRASGHGNPSLQTMNFGTKVGYFRQKPNQSRLEHVYGVHYDMDEGGDGHPVFHAQLNPAMDFERHIQEQFRLESVVQANNRIRDKLGNVRTPTAQMDFFSVITQLCADHLITDNSINSNPQVSQAFQDVRSACDFLQGAAHRLAHLNNNKAATCYRSTHWYG